MGFFYGFLTALFTGFQNRAIRRYKETDTLQLSMARLFFGTLSLFLTISLFSTWHIPEHKSFWALVFLTAVVETLVTFYYVRAFQYSDQSLVGPIFGLSPLFLVPLGIIFLNETLSIFGAIGVALVVFGALSLSWQTNITSIRSMPSQILQEKGVSSMFLAVLFASIAVTLTKTGFALGEPLVFGFFVILLLFIFYAALLLFRFGVTGLIFNKGMIVVGLLYGTGQVFHYLGLSMLPAAYFVSTKRTSILFDVLIGKFFGNEVHFKNRFVSSLVIFAGVLLFVLWG